MLSNMLMELLLQALTIRGIYHKYNRGIISYHDYYSGNINYHDSNMGIISYYDYYSVYIK